MSTTGSIVIVLLSVILLVTAVLLVRSRSRLPWPAIVVAALTSAVCFTVGGDSSKSSTGPSVATVAAGVAGLLSVIAAIVTLGPKRSAEGPAPRTPIVLAAAGIALGALGLLLNLLTG
jgi:hypothetical protein